MDNKLYIMFKQSLVGACALAYLVCSTLERRLALKMIAVEIKTWATQKGN